MSLSQFKRSIRVQEQKAKKNNPPQNYLQKLKLQKLNAVNIIEPARQTQKSTTPNTNPVVDSTETTTSSVNNQPTNPISTTTPYEEQVVNIEVHPTAPTPQPAQSKYNRMSMLMSVKNFTGSESESPEIWLSDIKSWQKFHDVNEELMDTVLNHALHGTARYWFENLKPEEKAPFNAFEIAFKLRFCAEPSTLKMSSMKQDVNENTTTYLARAEKEAMRHKTMTEKIKVDMIVNGLHNRTKAKVIGKEPKTFQELRKAVDLSNAELACLETSSVNSMATNYEDVITKTVETVMKTMSINPQSEHLMAVQQQQEHHHQPPPTQHYQPQQQHFYPQRNYHHQQSRTCQACGEYCNNPPTCPMLNQTCTYCRRPRHIFKACRYAAADQRRMANSSSLPSARNGRR